MTPPSSTPNEILDIDAADGDWTKRGQQWDISAANVEELRAWLRAQQMTVEKFKTLDVYRATLPRLPWLADL